MSSVNSESEKNAQRKESSPYAEMKVPFYYLAVFFVLGCVLLAVAVLVLHEEGAPGQDGWHKILLEHLGSAFIVASFIGFTYEFIVHRKREGLLKMYAEEHERATSTALGAFVAMSPGQILNLLKDIAMQVDRIPTLYTPARVDVNEYTFASSIDYFGTLVRAKRGEVVEVLREWVAPNSGPKLKFLASDFIGAFHLQELCGEMEAQVRFDDWEQVSEEVKAWRLNYAWAASRSSPKRYASLAGIARKTPFPDVETWIMFIPYQMKDREFLLVINAYLRRDDLNDEKLRQVVRALGELYQEDSVGVRRTFKKFGAKFNRPALLADIDKVLRSHNVNPLPVLNSVRRGLLGVRAPARSENGGD